MSKSLAQFSLSPTRAGNDYTVFDIKEPLRTVRKLKKTLESLEAIVRRHAPILEKINEKYWDLLPKQKQRDLVKRMKEKLTDLEATKIHLQKLKLPSDTDIAKAERFSLQQKTLPTGKRLIQKRNVKVASVLREKAYYENVIYNTEDWIWAAEETKNVLEGFEWRIQGLKGIVCHLYHRKAPSTFKSKYQKLLSSVFPDGVPNEPVSDSEDCSKTDDWIDEGDEYVDEVDETKDNLVEGNSSNTCDKASFVSFSSSSESESGGFGDYINSNNRAPRTKNIKWLMYRRYGKYRGSGSGKQRNSYDKLSQEAWETENEEEDDWEDVNENKIEELVENETNEEPDDGCKKGISCEYSGDGIGDDDDADLNTPFRNVGCQTEFVDVDDDSQFQDEDPSIPLFEVFEDTDNKIFVKAISVFRYP